MEKEIEDLIKQSQEKRKKILKEFNRKSSIRLALEIFMFINLISFMIVPTPIQIIIAIVLVITIICV